VEGVVSPEVLVTLDIVTFGGTLKKSNELLTGLDQFQGCCEILFLIISKCMAQKRNYILFKSTSAYMLQ
jgi:hypothetical protein